MTKNKHLQGWECSRCKKIHSPYLIECDCFPKYNIFIGNTTDDNEFNR